LEVEENTDLVRMLREAGYSEDIITRIIEWYSTDHPEVSIHF